MSSLKL